MKDSLVKSSLPLDIESSTPDEIFNKVKFHGFQRHPFIADYNFIEEKNSIKTNKSICMTYYYYAIMANDIEALGLLIKNLYPLHEVLSYSDVNALISRNCSEEFKKYINAQKLITYNGKICSFDDMNKLKKDELEKVNNYKNQTKIKQEQNKITIKYNKIFSATNNNIDTDKLCSNGLEKLKIFYPIFTKVILNNMNNEAISKNLESIITELKYCLTQHKKNSDSFIDIFQQIALIYYSEQVLEVFNILISNDNYNKIPFLAKIGLISNLTSKAIDANYRDHALFYAKLSYDLLTNEKNKNNVVKSETEFKILYNLGLTLTSFDQEKALYYSLLAHEINSEDFDNNNNIRVLKNNLQTTIYYRDLANSNDRPLSDQQKEKLWTEKITAVSRNIININMKESYNGKNKLFYENLRDYLNLNYLSQKIGQESVLKSYNYNIKKYTEQHGYIDLVFSEFKLFIAHKIYDKALDKLNLLILNKNACHYYNCFAFNATKDYVNTLVNEKMYQHVLDFLEKFSSIINENYANKIKILVSKLISVSQTDIKDNITEEDTDNFDATVDFLPSEKLAEFISNKDQKLVHAYFQNLKKHDNTNSLIERNFNSSTSTKWKIIEKEFTTNNENKFCFNNEYYYAIIDPKLLSKLEKSEYGLFSQALTKGIVTQKHGANGIKIVKKSIIELKINNSDKRLCADTIYKSKQTGEYFIIFNEVANHKEIKIKAKNKGTLTTKLVDTELIYNNELNQENDNLHDHATDFLLEAIDVVSDSPNIDDAKLMGDEA